MINKGTNKRLLVLTDGVKGPYILALSSQVDEIVKILNVVGVKYGVDDHCDQPSTKVINLLHNPSIQTIQDALDSVP